MSDKPHRYGTTLCMVCDSKIAYCRSVRFEVYVGARESTDGDFTSIDSKRLVQLPSFTTLNRYLESVAVDFEWSLSTGIIRP